MYGKAMQQVANEDIKYVRYDILFVVSVKCTFSLLALNPSVYCRYLHFDFHKICGHVHFERLSILYDQISDFLDKKRYLIFSLFPRLCFNTQTSVYFSFSFCSQKYVKIFFLI